MQRAGALYIHLGHQEGPIAGTSVEKISSVTNRLGHVSTHHSIGRIDPIHMDVLAGIPIFRDVMDRRELLSVMDYLLPPNAIARSHSLGIRMIIGRRRPADRDRAGVSSQA